MIAAHDAAQDSGPGVVPCGSGGAWPIHAGEGAALPFHDHRERGVGIMTWTRRILVAAAAALLIATPAAAQDRAVTFFARGGGYNALTDLNDAGDADLKKVGYTVGGGVAVQLHRYVSVRGDLSFGRNELRRDGARTGADLSRLGYTAAVQLQYPTTAGLEPYAFAGAGGITLHEVGT